MLVKSVKSGKFNIDGAGDTDEAGFFNSKYVFDVLNIIYTQLNLS